MVQSYFFLLLPGGTGSLPVLDEPLLLLAQLGLQTARATSEWVKLCIGTSVKGAKLNRNLRAIICVCVRTCKTSLSVTQKHNFSIIIMHHGKRFSQKNFFQAY